MADWIEFDESAAAAGQFVRLGLMEHRYHYVGRSTRGGVVLQQILNDGNGGSFLVVNKEEVSEKLGLWPKTRKIWVVVTWDAGGTRSFFGNTEEAARSAAERFFESGTLILCQECEVPA